MSSQITPTKIFTLIFKDNLLGLYTRARAKKNARARMHNVRNYLKMYYFKYTIKNSIYNYSIYNYSIYN